jgi:glycopeptide antibiotics resistance protein
VLFQEIRRFYVYREVLGPFAVFTNLVGNVLIFVPFGFFMALSSRTNGLGSAFFYSLELSLCVEIFQFFTKVGSFDVDDLLLNTLGGVCGYFLFFICNYIRRRQQYGRGKRKSSKKKSHR